MGDTRAVRTDVRTVFFLKGDWSLVELHDGQVAILRAGEMINGHVWPISAMGKAVVAFRQVSRTSDDVAAAAAAAAAETRQPSGT